jgi:hypothetical protein
VNGYLRLRLTSPLLSACCCWRLYLCRSLGEVTLHQLSQACVFIYSSHGKWAFSPLLWSFPPTATFTSFTAPGCWVCATTPAFSGRLIYLQFREGFPLPLLQHSGCPSLFATCLYCSYCLLLRFFFSFFPGWGSVCPGGYSDLVQGCL